MRLVLLVSVGYRIESYDIDLLLSVGYIIESYDIDLLLSVGYIIESYDIEVFDLSNIGYFDIQQQHRTES